MEPGLGAVIFLTFCIIGIFGLGFFLVYRVMNKPGSHIGARLPREDPDGAQPARGPDDPCSTEDGPGDDTGDDPEANGPARPPRA